jgi:hypothetical protein
LKLLKAFSDCGQIFHKIDQRCDGKIAGGVERKINAGLVTTNQVRDGEKGLKQKLLQRESAIKIINHTTSPTR